MDPEALTLDQIIRLMAGLSITWLDDQTITAKNGNPNEAADPLAVGFDVSGVKAWGAWRVEPPAGVAVDFRLWVMWQGKEVWDYVDGSERAGIDTNFTQELKMGALDRVYIERTDDGGSDWLAEIGEKQ